MRTSGESYPEQWGYSSDWATSWPTSSSHRTSSDDSRTRSTATSTTFYDPSLYAQSSRVLLRKNTAHEHLHVLLRLEAQKNRILLLLALQLHHILLQHLHLSQHVLCRLAVGFVHQSQNAALCVVGHAHLAVETELAVAVGCAKSANRNGDVLSCLCPHYALADTCLGLYFLRRWLLRGGSLEVECWYGVLRLLLSAGFVHLPEVLLLHYHHVHASHRLLDLPAVRRRHEGYHESTCVEAEQRQWDQGTWGETHLVACGIFASLVIASPLPGREVLEVQVAQKLSGRVATFEGRTSRRAKQCQMAPNAAGCAV